jgi:hypothetical protein
MRKETGERGERVKENKERRESKMKNRKGQRGRGIEKVGKKCGLQAGGKMERD